MTTHQAVSPAAVNPWKVVMLLLPPHNACYQTRSSFQPLQSSECQICIPHISWDISLGSCSQNVVRSGSCPMPAFLLSLGSRMVIFSLLYFYFSSSFPKPREHYRTCGIAATETQINAQPCWASLQPVTTFSTSLAPTRLNPPQSCLCPEHMARGAIVKRLMGIFI